MRQGEVIRKTQETDITLSLNLDGSGQHSISTGIGFFDHMLILWTAHGQFDLKIEAKGDLVVDDHHTVEDVGLALGQAFRQALGDKAGIKRYGEKIIPMDEALVQVVLDISNRPYLVFAADLPCTKVGEFSTEMTEEFMRAFATAAGMTLHIRQLAGKNAHHIIEAMFKALGRALDEASQKDNRVQGVPSTKGVLSDV